MADEDDSNIDAAVSGTPKLIRTVSVNKCPSFFEIENVMPEMAKRAEFITNSSDFRARIGNALAGRYAEREESVHVEQRIYAGFYSSSDRRLLERFQQVDWDDRLALIDQFEDARLRQLGKRLVFLYRPDLLSDKHRKAMQSAIRDRWLSNDPDTPWTTLSSADAQLDDINKHQAVGSTELTALIEYYRQFRKA